MRKLTRRELAEYTANQLIAGNARVVDELAAYLLQTHRVREARLVVRDTETALARNGVVIAHVSSASSLTAATRTLLSSMLRNAFSARQLHLDETVQPELLGGIKVLAADREFDSTVRRTLDQLKSIKV